MFIILFGSPGVGKGTQAKILSKKLSVPHVSTGDILRQAVKDESELGKQAAEIMAAGELVPDKLVNEIIKEALSKPEFTKGWILDGYPRTTQQAEKLDGILAAMEIDNYCLIHITANEEEIVRRLNNRRACKACNAIFTLQEIEGKNICPKCEAENSFYLRNDDKEDVIRNRIKVFHETTKPVLDHYEEQNRVITVNGIGSVKEVNEEIIRSLEKLNKV